MNVTETHTENVECASCGLHFTNTLKRDGSTHALIGRRDCPRCGCWPVAPQSAQSDELDELESGADADEADAEDLDPGAGHQ